MKPPKGTSFSAVQMAWWRSPGILYFFAAGSPAIAIKIGVTSVGAGKTFQSSLRARFAAIQSSNHETIELLGARLFTEGEMPMLAAETLERELHIRFLSLQRFKQHSRAAEWFNPSAELMSYIRQNSESPDVLGIPSIIAFPTNRSLQKN